MEEQLQRILARQSELEQALLGEQHARVNAQGELDALRTSVAASANGQPGLREDRQMEFRGPENKDPVDCMPMQKKRPLER